MTAMDILEALGQTGEELLSSCDEMNSAENKIQSHDRIPFLHQAKYRRAAAGIGVAAAVLLLAYAVGGDYMGGSFDSGNTGRSESVSTQDSAEISADTAEAETAEEAAKTEESALETGEGTVEDSESTAVTESSETSGELGEATASGDSPEEESVILSTLELAQVYLPGFNTSSLPEEEYAEMMALVELVQAEIDAALSAESMETLPVYRFSMADEATETSGETASSTPAVSGEESGQTGMTYMGEADAVYVNLIEDMGDYPVITQKEAEELLWQDYYLSPVIFSAKDADNAEVTSVELCYLVSAETLIYMPYYQFTVVVEEDMVYICCVPAVSREYLRFYLSD